MGKPTYNNTKEKILKKGRIDMANLIPRDLPGSEELLGKIMNSFWQERQLNTDIKEFADRYEIQADLPGIVKENIQVSYVADQLTITASQQSRDEKEEVGRYLRRERSSSAYQRSFTIADVDEENIKAKFENGVLFLTLPKSSYKNAPGKNIPID